MYVNAHQNHKTENAKCRETQEEEARDMDLAVQKLR